MPGGIKRFTEYMYTNGYSDPGVGKRGLLWFILLIPSRICRVLSVLRGIYFDRRFDRKHNVSTSGAIYLCDLNIDSENVEFGELYDPIPSGIIRQVLSFLPQSDLSETTFVDFGSGKGRVLFVAAEHNFKQIVGVEFSSELHGVAEENIRSFRSRKQKCNTLESICEDATRFPIPDGPCVFTIFAAFHGEPFIQVLENIKRSFLSNPRSIFILYVTDPNTHPIPMDDINGVDIFRLIRSGHFPFDLSQRYPMSYAIFEADLQACKPAQ